MDAIQGALPLPALLLPAAVEGAGTAVAHEPAGRWGGLPTESTDAKAARVRDKPDAGRSEAQSCDALPHPADQAVPIERRGHAVPQALPHDELEPCRTVQPLDDLSAADETKLPSLWMWRHVPGKLVEYQPAFVPPETT